MQLVGCTFVETVETVNFNCQIGHLASVNREFQNKNLFNSLTDDFIKTK